MSFQLVIAEKPSVAHSIAAVIGATEKQNGYWQGGGYLVSWCIGHLVSFAEAGQYDEKYCKWKYEDLPILPQPWQFIVPDEKKQQFEIVRSLLNCPDVDSVTAATDAGREGELIFRFVYQMAGCTKPVKRLWISSMEDAAIREGFANLRPDSDYDALYQSALCRAKADWLVGINATRLFSVLYHKTLTVGRVQTPTLKMLVDRDAKILRFQKEKYYTVGIHSGSLKADSGRIADAETANSLKESQEMTVRGESLGGGKVRIVKINSVQVDFSGEYSAIIVIHQDKPGVAAYITKCLSDRNVNIAFMRLFRESKGEIAYTIVESDGRLPEDIGNTIRKNQHIHEVMIVQM